MEKKKPWQSKTIITNVVVAIVAFFGDKYVAQFTPESIMMFLGAINIVLRMITKDKIGLVE